MELSLYSMLKEKVTNEETKNIKVYFVMKKKIEKIKKYVLVDNSIDSIAVFFVF